MRLFIHGAATCAVQTSNNDDVSISAIEDLPIKEYAKPAVRRRYGRVAKMMYIAAKRAIENAGELNPENLAVISATAMGEVKVGLDLLALIHEKHGSPISPALVPNAVHNAPAGHVTIGLKNHMPSVTLSQGWLSAEAAFSAATDLLAVQAAEKVLVLIGDEADPGWIDRLTEAGADDRAQALCKEAFKEGAVGFILGTKPGGQNLGSLLAQVERTSNTEQRIHEITRRFGSPGDHPAEIRFRVGAGGESLSQVSTGRLDSAGIGTSQLGAAAVLLDRIADSDCSSALLFGREVDDLGWLHWVR